MTVRHRARTAGPARTATRPTTQQPTRKSQPTKRAQDNMTEVILEHPITGKTWTDYYHETELAWVKQRAKETGVDILRVRTLPAHYAFNTNLGGTPE